MAICVFYLSFHWYLPQTQIAISRGVYFMSDRKNISHSTKKAVWEKCNGRCWYCGKSLNPFFVEYDHFMPHSKGGSDEAENLVTACPPCNRSKKDREVWEWRLSLYQKYNLGLTQTQKSMLKSEGIDIIENPYSWEPVILFYFERDDPKKRLPSLGYKPYGVIINYWELAQ
jgi:hypothetical protein